MVQKTSRIGLAGILALMDWDLLTSLVSQAATQATLEVGDWKLAKKQKQKQQQNKPFKTCQWYKRNYNKHAQLFRNLFSGAYFYGLRVLGSVIELPIVNIFLITSVSFN